MTTSLKTCFKCGAEKPLTEFYKHKQMGDGHLNKCKSCAKNDAFSHRRNPEYREKVLAYDRARGSRQTAEYREIMKKEKPLENKARNILSNAVRDGKIKKPDRCSHCHANTWLHGHHPDYTKPLEVVWLCVPCHRQLHALLDTVETKKVSIERLGSI